MAYSGGGGRSGTWTRVALIIAGLLVLAFLVSIVLRVVKLLVYAALLLVGIAVVLRAVRSRR